MANTQIDSPVITVLSKTSIYRDPYNPKNKNDRIKNKFKLMIRTLLEDFTSNNTNETQLKMKVINPKTSASPSTEKNIGS